MPFLISSWIPDIRLYNVVFFRFYTIWSGVYPGVVMPSDGLIGLPGVMLLLGRFADDGTCRVLCMISPYRVVML